MMKKRFRKIIALIMTAIIAVSCFCACGNDSAIDEEIDTSPLPAGMTFSDVCGLLYINGKQVVLPCGYDDIVALDDTIYRDPRYGVLIRVTNDEDCTIMYQSGKDGKTDKARFESVSIMAQDDTFATEVLSIDGTIKFGEDLSKIKELLGEPTTDTHGIYVNSDTFLWYAFKERDSLIRMHFTADDNGKLNGVMMLRTDWYKL